MPLRICHLGKFYPPAPGGIETHVQTLARAQAAIGADVQVLCVNHDVRGVDMTWRPLAWTRTVEEADGDVRVTRVGRYLSVSRLDFCPGLVSTLLRVRKSNPDIVHVHAPNPTMFGALAGLPPFATVVVTHHSDVIAQRLLRTVFSPIERVVHARAALVLSDSDGYIEGSVPLSRLRAKVRTLPLGLELERFRSPSQRARNYAASLIAEHGATIWLSVGRLVYYKGLSVALDALSEVPGKLLIVGQGPIKNELEQRAKRAGLSHRVVWLGHLDDEQLVGAYLAATALWFPSNRRSEGFGLAQVEAMAAGCPVINTAIHGSGVPWVSLDGVSGLTVPVNNPRALANAAQRLLDPALRERLAGGAQERAQSEFDHRVMAKRSLELYDVALGRTKTDQRNARKESFVSL